MEILTIRLLRIQNELEDALRMESTPEEVKETKEGKRILKYLRRRRRITNRLAKALEKL